MNETKRVQVFSSNTEEYHRAFQVFLNHTDQKLKAKERLDQCIHDLSARRVYIDAGAGNGKVTQWFTDLFERTIAIEPNESLRKELIQVCPRAEVHSDTILKAEISAPGDFVLVSHVFYYIDQAAWMDHLERLASWLAPGGRLVVIIQNHETDCMKMLEHFFDRSFNLKNLAGKFEQKHKNRYQVKMDTVHSYITTSDFDSAYTVAEFMLNLLPITDPPGREDLAAYVKGKFASNGGFRFSCHQDFLQIGLK